MSSLSFCLNTWGPKEQQQFILKWNRLCYYSICFVALTCRYFEWPTIACCTYRTVVLCSLWLDSTWLCVLCFSYCQVLSLCDVCKHGARWTRDWSGSERCAMARRKCHSESNLEPKLTSARSLGFTGIWRRSCWIDVVEFAIAYIKIYSRVYDQEMFFPFQLVLYFSQLQWETKIFF